MEMHKMSAVSVMSGDNIQHVFGKTKFDKLHSVPKSYVKVSYVQRPG